LWPREHGAYAELAFPILTGLGLAGPSVPALLLAVSVVCLFLAHEPLAVVLGVRGQRRKGSQGARARRRATVLLLAGGCLGTAGAALGWEALWPVLLVPLLPAALVVPLVLAGRQKTLRGEILVVTSLAALVLPLAAVTGVDPPTARWASLVWWLSFLLGTLEVHAIKARSKTRRNGAWTRWASPLACFLTLDVCAVALLSGTGVPAFPFLALIPPAITVLTVAIVRVHPRNLRRVGWTLVAANTLCLLVLLAG
jgi:hypothetical protein